MPLQALQPAEVTPSPLAPWPTAPASKGDRPISTRLLASPPRKGMGRGGAGGSRVCRRCSGPNGHPRQSGHQCVCFRRYHKQSVPADMLAEWEKKKHAKRGGCTCVLCNPKAAAQIKQWVKNKQQSRQGLT